MSNGWTIPWSCLLALIRMCGHKSQAFQALAHLWVGGLCVAWWITISPVAGWSVVVLSIVEVFCFFIYRPSGPDTDHHGPGPGLSGLRTPDRSRRPGD